MDTSGISQWTSTNGDFCLFMQIEFCNGTLDVWLEEHLTIESRWRENVVSIFSKILQGLDTIHNKDIVHRDIKPTNIFYKLMNAIKVWRSWSLKKNGRKWIRLRRTIACWKYYRSPEMAREEDYSYETDIYSTGLVFLEMLMPELVNILGKSVKLLKIF